MTAEVRNHLSLPGDPPSLTRVGFLLGIGDLGSQTDGGEDDGVVIIVQKQFLEVSQDGALVHRDTVPDPLLMVEIRPRLPLRLLPVDESVLSEERVDAVTDHQQLAVAGGAVQLQLPDDDVEGVDFI